MRKKNGISDAFIQSAQQSPVWKFVKEWELALPLHPEFRTMPMLYYVPPLLPVMGRSSDGMYEHDAEDIFSGIGKARLPLQYLAALFTAGNLDVLEAAMRKLMAVRHHTRAKDIPGQADRVRRILREARLTPEQAEDIYRLTALATMEERYVLPPIQREEAVGELLEIELCKGTSGLGMAQTPQRGG